MKFWKNNSDFKWTKRDIKACNFAENVDAAKAVDTYEAVYDG